MRGREPARYPASVNSPLTAPLQRNLFATPLFWGGIAFLLLFAVAGSLVVAGAGPSAVGAIIGTVVALDILAIGVVLMLAVTAPRILRGRSADEDWGYW